MFSYLFCSLSHQVDIRTRKQCKYLIEQGLMQQNTHVFPFKKCKTDTTIHCKPQVEKKHVLKVKAASTANRTSSCSTAQFQYSPLFIQLLFHHVSPPGWHRGQTSGLLLSLHVDTGVKGNMGGDGSPCSSVKDLN